MAPSRRKVTVSAQWAKRNAAARNKGYASYYDYRSHNYGRTPPSAPRAKGEQLARLRGHRARADLYRGGARDGDVVSLQGSSGRDKRGRFEWVEVTVYGTSGDTRTYRLSGKDMRPERLEALLDQLEAQGAIITLIYPADLRKLRP